MPLTDEQIGKAKQRLREMSDEELQLGPDIGTIDLKWEQVLAELERKRRDREYEREQLARQLEVANRHADAANGAATAAKRSAGATIALAIATTFLAVAAVAPHISVWIFQLNR